jgi:hypothetical protein
VNQNLYNALFCAGLLKRFPKSSGTTKEIRDGERRVFFQLYPKPTYYTVYYPLFQAEQESVLAQKTF